MFCFVITTVTMKENIALRYVTLKAHKRSSRGPYTQSKHEIVPDPAAPFASHTRVTRFSHCCLWRLRYPMQACAVPCLAYDSYGWSLKFSCHSFNTASKNLCAYEVHTRINAAPYYRPHCKRHCPSKTSLLPARATHAHPRNGPFARVPPCNGYKLKHRQTAAAARNHTAPCISLPPENGKNPRVEEDRNIRSSVIRDDLRWQALCLRRKICT